MEIMQHKSTKTVRKSVVLDGTAGKGQIGTVNLFTVTGGVMINWLSCICTEDLASAGGGTVEVGISGATASFIAQATATDVDLGDIWHDATPDAASELASVFKTTAARGLGNGQDIILTVATGDVTDGTLEFTLEYTPLTATGSVVAA